MKTTTKVMLVSRKTGGAYILPLDESWGPVAERLVSSGEFEERERWQVYTTDGGYPLGRSPRTAEVTV